MDLKNKSNNNKIQHYFIGILVIFIIIIFIFLFLKYNLNVNYQDNEVKKIAILKWVDNPEYEKNIKGFKETLEKNGYIEGINIKYIELVSNANRDLHFNLTKNLIESENVDIIYSLTTPGTLIVKSFTREIPIVFSIVTYPVEVELINSLDNSGNNLVGSRNYILPSRQFALFESITPNINTIGIAYRKNEPNSEIQLIEFKKILEPRGIKIIDLASIDSETMIKNLEKNINSLDAIYLACDTLISSGAGKDIIFYNVKNNHNKPIYACNQDGIIDGALAGVVANWNEIGKISGEKASLILKGANPSWLVTESSRKNYIIINQKTASEIGINIPQDIF